MKRVLLLVALLCSLSSMAVADDLAAKGDSVSLVRGITRLWVRDSEGALRELLPLAKRGNGPANYWLGYMYDYGRGVPKDYVEAMRWYRKAAEQGESSAQRRLGYMYGVGRGVTKDDVESYIWYNLAAAGGDKTALEVRDRMAAKLSPDQLQDAQRAAKKRWERIQRRKK